MVFFELNLLFISRIIQGLCIGGDSAANSVIIYNNSINGKKFRSSFLCGSTSIIGFLLALIISFFITKFFGENNWRFAFLISIFITFLTLYLRLKFINTKNLIKKDYNKVNSKFKISLIYYSILSIFSFSFIGYLFYYKIIFVTNIFSNNYSYSNQKIDLINSISMIINLPFMFISSILCDKIRYFKFFPIILAIFVIPFLNYFILQGNLYSFFIYDAVYAMAAASIIPSVLGSIPEKIRSVVFGFSFNFSYGFFSSLNLFLINFNKFKFINFYSIFTLLSFLSILFYIIITRKYNIYNDKHSKYST